MTWLFLAVAILSEVTGTLSMRASEGFRHRAWITPFVVMYAISFGALALTLHEGMPIGVIYAVWSACGVALTAGRRTSLLR